MKISGTREITVFQEGLLQRLNSLIGLEKKPTNKNKQAKSPKSLFFFPILNQSV